MQENVMSNVTFNKSREFLGVHWHEDGYWRCIGRLVRGKVPFDTKESILLPNSNQLTDLLYKEIHEKMYPNGVQETLAQILLLFWIPKWGQTVRTVTKKFMLCKRLE